MKFDLDEQQRDFAASIDAALGAADLPAAVRAWAEGDTAPGRKVWAQLTDLGVTALMVPEKFDGIEAHPVDLVVAAERLGRWCVPGPVTESIAVAPVLLADDDRSAALAAGELIATVAMPPQVPRALDADTAGVVLVAADGSVRDGTAGEQHESVDPSRKLFDVTASGEEQSVEYAKQRSQFGRVIGSYQSIKHNSPTCSSRSSWRAHSCTGRRFRWPTTRPTRRATSALPRSRPPTPRCWRRARRCKRTAP